MSTIMFAKSKIGLTTAKTVMSSRSSFRPFLSATVSSSSSSLVCCNRRPSNRQQLRQIHKQQFQHARFPTYPGRIHVFAVEEQRRSLSFSFAGPKKLDDILQKDKISGLNATEISDLWMSYHEQKDNVHGLVRSGGDGIKMLDRAKSSPFFIQPVVKQDEGFYMLVSQFIEPCHFILAYLEDYRLDPAAATPLMSFTVFTDFAESPPSSSSSSSSSEDDVNKNAKDLTLVRVDITNKGLADDEGYKVATFMLDSYTNDTEYNQDVKPFNAKPDSFDIEGYISRQNEKWTTYATDDENRD